MQLSLTMILIGWSSLRFCFVLIIIGYSKAFQPLISNAPITSDKQWNKRRDTIVTCQMEPTTIIAVGGAITAAAAMLFLSGSEEREKRKQYSEWEEKDRLMKEERARLAFIEPREYWREEELRQYDGSDEEGPILMAVNGDVYNVWKGRHFYGPGCEYHILAGRDATRLLAKTKLEEETEEEKKIKLSIADRAALQGWIYTFKTKYEIVGKLEGFDPATTTTRPNMSNL